MDTKMDGAFDNGASGFAEGPHLQHHTLIYDFPACQLLPEGKRPFIEKPTAMGDREEPEYTAMGLDADDVEFYLRTKTTYSSNDEDADLSSLAQPLNLCAAIQQLSTLAGISHLRVVSYVGDDDVLTRFQLSTVFYIDGSRVYPTDNEFEMGSAEVTTMIKKLRKEAWVKQLSDLIHCDSDRAYLCTTSKLLDYDEDWTLELEESWGPGWDRNPFKSVRQMFADRLLNYYQREDGSTGTEPIGDLKDCRDMAIRVQLPCGHGPALLPSNWIHDSKQVDLLWAVCDACNRRIMTRKDVRSIELYRDKLKRSDWEESMMEWVPKCKKVRNDARVVEITSAALTKSLEGALPTFKLPASISPPIYCPTTQPEGLALLEKLGEALKPYATLPAMTPRQLFKNLEELIWTLLGQGFADTQVMSIALPPGFDSFLTRWLRRAVNDALGTQADEGNDAEVMDVLQKMRKTKIDPRAAAIEDDLDDILGKFGKGGLLGDAAKGDGGDGQDLEDDEEL